LVTLNCNSIGDKMSIDKNTKSAIKHHFSGLDKLKDGVKDWIACGENILKIKKALGHGEFIPYVEKTLPFTRQQAAKYTRFATQAPALLEIIEEHGALSQNEALKMLPAASQADMAYVGSISNDDKTPAVRNSDNWHTPDGVIDAVKHVMDGIDLDPFSSDEANARIEAKEYFTIEDNSLEQEWKADSVFVNPPYGRKLIGQAIDKIVEQYENNAFKECIVLVNNATDTLWFHKIASISRAMCLTKGRIAFLSPAEDGVMKQVSSNTRGQTLFYIGDNVSRFIDTFKNLGLCVEVNNENA